MPLGLPTSTSAAPRLRHLRGSWGWWLLAIWAFKVSFSDSGFVNSAQPTLRNRTLRGIGVSGEARGPPVPAAATVEGQELEEMLWKASREAEVRFFMSYQSLARRGRDGSVPGFRRWLDDLKLDGYAKQALVWAEEMGASDLEEVLENLEDFMEKIGLGEKLEDEEDMEAFYAKAAAAAEQIQVTNRPSLHLNSSEREDLWHFWSLRRPGVELYRAFGARVAELAEPAAAAGTGSLEERLSTELRARLEGDLQYLVVMREYHALHLPRLPSLESSNGTWTFCGGSEEWLRRADGAAAPVPLPPLERAVKRTMQEAILGGQPRGARFLETYLAMERFHPEDLPDSPCEVVNVSKQAVLQAVRAVAGAAGLPDWNRSFDDAPVPLAITPESLQNRSEVVKQVRRYFDLMANTRVAQADKYFGHVLFGLLLSRVCQRFDLLQEAQLLSSDLESQRAPGGAGAKPLGESAFGGLRAAVGISRHGRSLGPPAGAIAGGAPAHGSHFWAWPEGRDLRASVQGLALGCPAGLARRWAGAVC